MYDLNRRTQRGHSHWRKSQFSTHLEDSQNGGTPKSSILIEFSIINHPFGVTPHFGKLTFQSFGGTWQDMIQIYQNIETHRNSISFSHLICQHLAQATAFFVDLCFFQPWNPGVSCNKLKRSDGSTAWNSMLSLAAIGFTRRLWNRGSYAAVSPKTWNLQTWNPHGQTYGIQHIRTRIKCVRRIAQWLLRHEENVLRKEDFAIGMGPRKCHGNRPFKKSRNFPRHSSHASSFHKAVSVLKHFVLLMVRTCSNIYIYIIFILGSALASLSVEAKKLFLK